jgi:hypothetical protein
MCILGAHKCATLLVLLLFCCSVCSISKAPKRPTSIPVGGVKEDADTPDDASAVQYHHSSLTVPPGLGDLPPAAVTRFVPEVSGSWRGNDALRFSSTYAQVPPIESSTTDFDYVKRWSARNTLQQD